MVFDLGRELGGHHQRVGLVVFGAYLARLIQLYGLYRLFALMSRTLLAMHVDK